VIVLLRWIGVMNAAVWLGATVVFGFVALPAVFSDELKHLLGDPYVGLVAQKLVARYFVLQCWCAVIALAHLLAEWVYLGRRLHRVTLGIVLALLTLGLVGGLWLQPKMNTLHRIKYSSEFYRREVYSAADRAAAARAFRSWHIVARVADLLGLVGLIYYTWRVVNPSDETRFLAPAKFRG
jgi:hypothetical protein